MVEEGKEKNGREGTGEVEEVLCVIEYLSRVQPLG